jgi:septal ring factor EnvC (AmiA/AmiB activator)
MSNKLKKFIWDNRNEFDDAVPSDKVWQHIESSMTGKKEKKFILTPLYKWSMAAAAVLLLSAGVYFFENRNKNTKIEYAGNIPAPDTATAVEAPEVNQFAKMIALKQEELRSLAKDQPELYSQFTKDITQLDSSYNILKKQLSATPNRELLLEAMIQNLQLQLNVLNQQLNIIHQIKQSKKYNHEKIDQAI